MPRLSRFVCWLVGHQDAYDLREFHEGYDDLQWCPRCGAVLKRRTGHWGAR